MNVKKDWKTTVSGLLAALPQTAGFILPLLGIAVPPVEVLNGITAVGVFLIGLFAVDGSKDAA